MKITRKKGTLVTEINMVPFIDVVLVLLIIFMVMSPFLAQSELPIRLPRALSGLSVQGDDPLKVRVTKDGDVYVGAERVIRADLENKLKTVAAGKPVLIEADRDVSFKSVVFALDAAERAGAAKVGVAVENPEPQ
jgi:biopolymer transport protein ExbD